MLGPGQTPFHPRGSREMGLFTCQPALLAVPPQGPRLLGHIRACSPEGQASKSRDFTCEKLKIKRF